MQELVQLLHQVDVAHRRAVALLPTTALPALHPLRGGVDQQLRVGAQRQTLQTARVRLANRHHSAEELAAVVRSRSVNWRRDVVGVVVAPEDAIAGLNWGKLRNL